MLLNTTSYSISVFWFNSVSNFYAHIELGCSTTTDLIESKNFLKAFNKMLSSITACIIKKQYESLPNTRAQSHTHLNLKYIHIERAVHLWLQTFFH